jgi:hypothetical protein
MARRRAKKANIKKELFRAIDGLDFARERYIWAKQLNPPYNENPSDEDKELLLLRRKDYYDAYARAHNAARRAIDAIPEDET